MRNGLQRNQRKAWLACVLAGISMLLAGACTGNNSPLPSAPSTPTSTAPTLTSILPATGSAGTTVSATLSGTGFVVGATTIAISGSGVTASGTIVQSASSLTTSFVIDAAAAPGARTVTITTAGGTSAPQSFSVMAAATVSLPSIASLRQQDGATGTTVSEILTGTHFAADATTVTVSGSGVTVTGVVVTSSTSLNATFLVDGSADLGPRNVTVTTPAGTSAPVTFTVTTPSQVSCIPSTQTVGVGVTASFSAVGGYSSFSWSAPSGSPATGPDSATFSTTYAAAGTYTVTVARGTTAKCSVTVQASTPVIGSFSANPTTFVAGHATTLSWSGITNATTCAIDHGVGTVACANGSTSVTPAASVTYTLTATGSGGAATATAAVVVIPHGSQTFAFTGAQQNFVVPSGVTSITVQASGGQGGNSGPGTLPGNGGSVTATIAVTPGESLAVFVGGQGSTSGNGLGGFNGGGNAPADLNRAGGGGGGSDVRQGGSTLANRVVVAGGGGGAGFRNFGGAGGAGGGTTGGAGGTVFDSTGGSGGTQAAGGAGGSAGGGGTAGSPGALGIGGAGGDGNVAGGGGGGGYFGGGGAGSSLSFPTSGGGGGSSFTAPGATGVTHTQGNHTGNGVVVISW